MSVQEQFAKLQQTGFRHALAVLLALAPESPVARIRPDRTASAGWINSVLKRALDLVVAVPTLILCLPLLAAIGLVIRLDSAGPVFFRQQRLGLGGSRFAILKFRTMTVLEDGETVIQASRNDPRVTRAGRFLRSSSLDELPQLINVIKGDMSLVGPRPHALAHDMLYTKLIANYARRQDTKPGVTGWAQIHGLRGATPSLEQMRRRVDHDVWYTKNASILLDLLILLRTPGELLRRRNAY